MAIKKEVLRKSVITGTEQKREEKETLPTTAEVKTKVIEVTWECPHCIYMNIEVPTIDLINNETVLTCISCSEKSIVTEIKVNG